jgi:DNA modification methylase
MAFKGEGEEMTEPINNFLNKIICGDALSELKKMPNESVDCVITSPPYYGLRDYGVSGQIGLEETPETYLQRLVEIFREVKRVLKDDGTLWLNLGDSYAHNGACGGASPVGKREYRETDRQKQEQMNYKVPDGLKHKDLIGIPWRVAFALQADGWYLRQDIIWNKPNPMPESVTDRCTKSHEYIFLLAKNQKYYFDNEAIREPFAISTLERTQYGNSEKNKLALGQYAGMTIKNYDKYAKKVQDKIIIGRNKRSVWTVTTQPFPEAHFATFPEDLVLPCILAGSKVGDIIFDPFIGSGTAGLVALKNNRKFVGIELNPKYVEMANRRLKPFLDQRNVSEWLSREKVGKCPEN